MRAVLKKKIVVMCGVCPAGGPVSYVSYEELGTPFDEEAFLRALSASS